MGISIEKQALSLLCFACIGLGTGLLYDMIRPMRYRSKAEFLWDGLFCFLSAGLCFVLSSAFGSMGLWDMAAACGGFCLYINYLSPAIFPFLLSFSNEFEKLCRLLAEKIKKLMFLVKKSYTNPED